MKLKNLLLIFFLVVSQQTWALDPTLKFFHISYDQGLSNNCVNCVLKSSRGFLWVGTSLGLDRYDGFSIRTYFSRPGDPTSLPDNYIEAMVEPADGKLWVWTSKGFCIYDPLTETFDNDVEGWMKRHGMSGTVIRACTDQERNLWIVNNQNQLYYYDFIANKATRSFNIGERGTTVSNICLGREMLAVVYVNGLVRTYSTSDRRLLGTFDFMKKLNNGANDYFKIFIDSQNNLWVYSSAKFALGANGGKTWKSIGDYVVRCVAEDHSDNILLATDHEGLVQTDHQGNRRQQWLHVDNDLMSLPDNTLQYVYVDDLDIVWVGTYRLGLAFCYSGQKRMNLLPLGDVCSMSEDSNGRLWIGTNDKGIELYDFNTRQSRFFTKAESGLGSDIVVSTLVARDGSLWFGTFLGGLAHYKDGHFTVYRQKPGQLASDNVWALSELPDGRIAIATLGGGFQLLDVKSGQFKTYNSHNSQLPSDYVASLDYDAAKGYLVIGHSLSVSLLNVKTGRIVNIPQKQLQTHADHLSFAVNQVISDSRHLIWIATANGLWVYDVSRHQSYEVQLQGLQEYVEVEALVEDKTGQVWATTSNGLKRIKVSFTDGKWNFFVDTYEEFGIEQARLFNKRSMLCLRDGRVLAGGIDGVNVIDNVNKDLKLTAGKIIFSDLVVFDHVVKVGEKFNGHVILDKAINESRSLDLRDNENEFAIRVATNLIGKPDKPRYLYRLKGFNDHWTMTAEAQSSIRFTNISPGHYTLEVRLVDDNGNPQPDVARLKIVVHPPFYLSWWAFVVYLVLIILGVYYGHKVYRRRRQAERERLEFQKQKEVDEMKLVFFTNVSHELRTPLTLILSPLSGIIEKEDNPEIVKKLKLIQRNAHKMLSLVNDILDFRRMVNGKDSLHIERGNIVATLSGVCRQFAGLTSDNVRLTFVSDAENITMDYDQDKVSKILTNLLSNAYKFVPKEGCVDVRVSVDDNKTLELSVTDNGPGISDEDKKHLFERFYQSKTNMKGGTGIGLNLVANFAQMLGGMVRVEDNPKGGARFVVSLPVGDGTVSGKGYAFSSQGDEVESAPSAEQQSAAPRYKVLVVDDNADFLDFLSGELKGEYNVVTAVDGCDAMSKVEEDRPDIVLTDVMMPKMDGNELCLRLKQHEDTKGIPVVLLTARLPEENEKQSLYNGADDYFNKPFDLDVLKQHINDLIKRSQEPGKVVPRIKEDEITTLNEQFTNDATAYVEKHLDDTSLTVESMSKDLGMSRVNLYRHMVAATGMTPSEFVRLVRLRHAEKLVKKSQLTVAEIAYKVGFGSPRYFSKCYKELFGYLPSQYKKE